MTTIAQPVEVENGGRSRAPCLGALLAGLLPFAFVIVDLLHQSGFPREDCTILVSAPLLISGMALPTYLAGRVTSRRGAWIAVPAMLAAAGVSGGVIGMTWMLWGGAANEVCRSI